MALDPRHKTHNIPGKFLSYMQAGIPVLGIVNPGNDLIDLIAEFKVGKVAANSDMAALKNSASLLLEFLDEDKLANINLQKYINLLRINFSLIVARDKIINKLH